MWFSGKTRGYSDQLKISKKCVGCGLCSKICPMHNITVKDKKRF
ncbi:4Fe-4S binding protein [Pseudoramibacter faecis]